MITLTIDNKEVQAPEGSTILQAAESVGIHIPTLCYAKNLVPSTSCMVCVVRIEGIKGLVPACGMHISENMHVTTRDEQIQRARKAAVELLLSDHVGDCLGPCMIGCPANMNIPLMLRQIYQGDFQAAIETVKKDIPLPAILGRICPAPCEKVCRRSQADDAVAICLLKRVVADLDLKQQLPYRPDCAESTGKKVAIVGAGPAGLSAAYYLEQAGIDCAIYDDHEHPGGSLRYADMDRDILPLEVVEKEIEQILALGIAFHGNIRLGKDVSLAELKSQYDAVLLAVGDFDINMQDVIGIAIKENKIQADRRDYTTSERGIFAAGRCIGSRNIAVRAVADGKEAASSIVFYLSGQKNIYRKQYNHKITGLEKEEIEVFLKLSNRKSRIDVQNAATVISQQQAQDEASRCLHCDCRKSQACRLRDLATQFEARQKAWPAEKQLFRQLTEHPDVIFEPGKCIKCGLCIQTAQQSADPLGLSFKGRGYDMQVGVPLEKSLKMALTAAADACVSVCPTGALAYRNE